MTDHTHGLQLTPHARRRMRQRSIGEPELAVALALGAVSHSFGDLVYTVTDRCLRGTRWAHLADRLRGLSVVVAPDDVVKTVMWDHHTRRHAGVLRRARQAA